MTYEAVEARARKIWPGCRQVTVHKIRTARGRPTGWRVEITRPLGIGALVTTEVHELSRDGYPVCHESHCLMRAEAVDMAERAAQEDADAT